jgi:hypothetical protein
MVHRISCFAAVGALLLGACQLVSGIADMGFAETAPVAQSGGSGGTGGDGGGGSGGGKTPCSEVADCPEVANPCERRSCTGGWCVIQPSTAGPAFPDKQKAGDCKLIVCDGFGSSAVVPDETDVPSDDKECTLDECVQDFATHEPLAIGTPCKGGFCDGEGACTECASTADCIALGKPDAKPDTECRTRVCESGTCKWKYAASGTPAALQSPNDCKKSVCDGMGEIVEVASTDIADQPDDGKDCTTDACNGTTPTFTPIDCAGCCGTAKTLTCAMGVCTGCTASAECTGSTFCRTAVCQSGNCGLVYEPAGEKLPNAQQKLGDCQVKECDGNGNVVSMPDASDAENDGNECTLDKCEGGASVHTPEPLDKPCTGGYCDGNGACVACNNKTQCPESTKECEEAACTNNKCGFAPVANGTPVAMQTSGDCKKVVCDGMGGTKTVTDDSDVPNDGKECTTDTCDAGTPKNTPKAAGTACTQNGGKKCDGGDSCVQCLDDGDCAAGDTCDTASKICVGALKDDGQQCTTGTQCKSGECADGVCCDKPCDGSCEACNLAGTEGDCSPVKNAADADTCAKDEKSGDCAVEPCTCDASGVCKQLDGTACAGGTQCESGQCVDGVCCATACGSCQRCDATPGTCTSVTNGPDADTCDGDSMSDPCKVLPCSCDGGGVCKQTQNGSACTMSTQCLSGHCKDGVCCATACTGACQTCAATPGTCTSVTNGPDDDTCDANSASAPCANVPCSCDGGGACKQENGTACTMPTQCLSGKCKDGVCCAADCTGVCQTCAATPGTCTSVTNGPDDDTCDADSLSAPCSLLACSCDGGAACKRANGTACTMPTQCASGNCKDGVCCNTPCGDTCKTCNKAGAVGTCSPVANFSQDETCQAAGFCCVGGNCQQHVNCP